MGANYYLIKGNPERLKIESDRVSAYLNDKYKNDEFFREKKRLYQKEYRLRKKMEKLNYSLSSSSSSSSS